MGETLGSTHAHAADGTFHLMKRQTETGKDRRGKKNVKKGKGQGKAKKTAENARSDE